MGWHDYSDADGFAISMLLIVFLGLGTAAIVIAKVVLHSRLTAPSPEDELMDEALGRTSTTVPEKAAMPPAEPALQPWERESDWWKEKA